VAAIQAKLRTTNLACVRSDLVKQVLAPAKAITKDSGPTSTVVINSTTPLEILYAFCQQRYENRSSII
jgi:hypothetical protein